jgi:membrane-associated phospholipid phosphatase
MKLITKFLSVLFFPLFIPIYGAFMLFNLTMFSFYPSHYIWGAYLAFFAFGTVIPFSCIFIWYKLKIISNMELKNSKDRFLPYFCTAVSYYICAAILSKLALPMYVPLLMVAVAVALFINAIISIWWKISAHMTGVSGLLGGILCVSWKLCINPSLWFIVITLVCGLVAAARLYLNAHTQGQIAAGFLNGLLCTIIIPNLGIGYWIFF